MIRRPAAADSAQVAAVPPWLRSICVSRASQHSMSTMSKGTTGPPPHARRVAPRRRSAPRTAAGTPPPRRRARRAPAPGRRPLQFGGGGLVGRGRCGRQVPRAAVRIGLRVGDVRQRQMDGPAVLLRRRPVYRRPHQRMAERHAGAERQPLLRAVGERLRLRHAEPAAGTPHQGRRLGRGEQQHRDLPGQLLDPGQEALLDPSRQRVGAQQAEPARHLRHRQPARQLQQRERVALVSMTIRSRTSRSSRP